MLLPSVVWWSQDCFSQVMIFFSSKSHTYLGNGHLLCGEGSRHLADGMLLASMAPCGRGAHARCTRTSPILLVAEHLQPWLRSVAKQCVCFWRSRGCFPGPRTCCVEWHLWHGAPVPAAQGWAAACVASVCQASVAAFWPAEMESEFKRYPHG